MRVTRTFVIQASGRERNSPTAGLDREYELYLRQRHRLRGGFPAATSVISYLPSRTQTVRARRPQFTRSSTPMPSRGVGEQSRRNSSAVENRKRRRHNYAQCRLGQDRLRAPTESSPRSSKQLRGSPPVCTTTWAPTSQTPVIGSSMVNPVSRRHVRASQIATPPPSLPLTSSGRSSTDPSARAVSLDFPTCRVGSGRLVARS
jgi:hypothetical protein